MHFIISKKFCFMNEKRRMNPKPHGKNGFVDLKILLDTNLKIILLDYQNNDVDA